MSRQVDELDIASAETDRDIRISLFRLQLMELERHKTRINRMRTDDYGNCVDCELPIPKARLKALPGVDRCIHCQEVLEFVERKK